jgi:hypothetical protein
MVFVDYSELVGGDVRILIGQAVGRWDVASVESKLGPVLHPETRRTE